MTIASKAKRDWTDKKVRPAVQRFQVMTFHPWDDSFSAFEDQ